MVNDDIAAIATPPGESGIAIIRTSGENVIEKVNKIFKPYKKGASLQEKKGYTISLGWIMDKDEILDEVLISIMRAPRSYTGENTVEIHCHGGTIPARRCLEILMKQDVRLAEPGEFTKRAFLNGRMDINQAEAVIDIIRAKTSKGLQLAVKQMTGENKKYIGQLEDKLLSINALVEASIDFPDEVGDPDYVEVQRTLEDIKNDIDKLVRSSEKTEIYREGVNIAICGKPNVGKSSLLNALIKKDKAIVTDIPGTTRDIIEEYINIKGIPVKIIDTAGIRQTEDVVESIGVEKTREAIKNADLIIFLLDVATGITKEDLEIYEIVKNLNVIVLVNKEDLEEKNIDEQEFVHLFKNIKIIRGSVKEEIGIEDLENSIESSILSGEIKDDNMEVMLNIRQKNALKRARKHIEEAITTLNKVSLDCLSVDIWSALESIGEITGKNLKEDVVDRIFHDFCIGK